MLRTEKLKRSASVTIKEPGASFGKTRFRTCQKGSILIGLIITMVVMASLGAGMVYLTSTSTFQEIFANNHARAYYAAESGGRYASALARQALATNTFATLKMDTTNPDNFISEYSLANGDRFLITNWTPNLVGGSMIVTFDSIGTTGSGFLQAKRRLNYRINPANQIGGGYAGPKNFDALPEVTDFDNVTTPGLAAYFSPTDPSDTKIQLVKDNPTDPNDTVLNLADDYYTIGLLWYSEANKTVFPQLDSIRAFNDGLLSYSIQLKIKPDTNSENDYFMAGISFRLDDIQGTGTLLKDNMYGLSFLKIDKSSDKKVPNWYDGTSDPWTNIGINKTTSTVCPNTRCDWDTISTNEYYVVLFKRNGGTYGQHTLLAYKKLSEMSGVLDGTDLRAWSTLMVKVKEVKGSPSDQNGFTSPSDLYNIIECYLQVPELYPRRLLSDPNKVPISWNNSDFTQINWIVAPSAGGAKKGKDTFGTEIPNVIVDNSLNTLHYSNYTTSTVTKARELGIHVYFNSGNARNVFFDNFYIDLSPSTGIGGFIDGTGQVVQGP